MAKRPIDEKKRKRRSLKRAIAAAKRDPKVKDLPKKEKRRAAARLGRKSFRAAEAARPKKAAPAAPAAGEGGAGGGAAAEAGT